MSETPTDRRSFLGLLTLGLGAATSALVAVPGLGYLIGPALNRARSGITASLGKADAFVPGKPVRVAVLGTRIDGWTRHDEEKLGAVWVRREEGGAFTCYLAVCPHLGCSVDFEPGKGEFLCPCHGSHFDARGKRLAGPSPRDLDTLATVVEDGELRVHYTPYRQGIARKEPL